ncbi:hypothetical protein C8R48DRAFT_774829 [Suillus tomentosus]|nr:hypothetical protein C8R48DRAFT_774829 [Suillus tomentosus]
MHNHGSRTKGPIHKVSVAKSVNTQPVKHKSDLKDQDEESEEVDTAPMSPLRNPYTQVTVPESSSSAILATQHHPSCFVMQLSA